MHNNSRRAKIVCTLGPASQSPEMMRAFLLNGLDVARFNFSHGGPNQHAAPIAQLRRISEAEGKPVAILQDLCGPKIRTGPLLAGVVTLQNNARFTLTTRSVAGDENEVSVTYDALPRDCHRGDSVMLDDGLIVLHVEETNETDVVCTVVDGGVLRPSKGINLPGVHVSAPALSHKDRHDAEWGVENGVDYIALSFVRSAEDILELRRLIDAQNGRAQIIAKLEKPEAIEVLDEIVAAADGVMVARGDLGVEMPAEQVPILQKRIIATANAAGKLVITATQMLESMTKEHRPTRAEASDVANAVFDGSDALMLSGETAVGAYPLESLQTMSRIIEFAENSAPDIWLEYRRNRRTEKEEFEDFTGAICEAAARVAEALRPKAIVCFTESGGTARRLAKSRPPVPIIAFTPDPVTARGLGLAWGIQAHLVPRLSHTDEMITQADEVLCARSLAVKGDEIVITLGAPVALHGSTNLLKLHRIGEADIR